MSISDAARQQAVEFLNQAQGDRVWVGADTVEEGHPRLPVGYAAALRLGWCKPAVRMAEGIGAALTGEGINAAGSLPVRVAMTGGRDFTGRDLVFAALDEVRERHGTMVLVHGGAAGADTLAQQWAEQAGVATEVHQPDWDSHGKAAGSLCNATMARSGLELLVAFPGGRGTLNMIERCESLGVPVERHEELPPIPLIEDLVEVW